MSSLDELLKQDEQILNQAMINEFGIEKIHGTSLEKYDGHVKLFLNDYKELISKIKKKTFLILSNSFKFRLPEKGEQIRIRTQKQLNLITLILRILQVHKQIDEITLSTYTLNREAINIFTALLKSGKLKRLNLLVASSYSFRDVKYYNYLKNHFRILSSHGIDVHLTFAWIHLKITLIRIGSIKYQMESSMNYSTNNFVEQILIEQNPDVYDFDYEFLTEVILDRLNKALEVVV